MTLDQIAAAIAPLNLPTYRRGDVLLVNGDCLQLLPRIPSHTIDAIVSDFPYGMDLQPQRGCTEAIEGDSRNIAKSLWWAAIHQCHRIAKKDASHLFFGRWSEEWCKAVLDEWFTVKACIVWRKNMWGIGYYTRPQHEFIWYCHKGTPPTPATCLSDVWDFACVQAPIHSCEKPMDLMVQCVRFSAGELICDPFVGSGTTPAACVQCGKSFVGFELSSAHFELACQRVDAEFERLALLEPPPPRLIQPTMFGGSE